VYYLLYTQNILTVYKIVGPLCIHLIKVKNYHWLVVVFIHNKWPFSAFCHAYIARLLYSTIQYILYCTVWKLITENCIFSNDVFHAGEKKYILKIFRTTGHHGVSLWIPIWWKNCISQETPRTDTQTEIADYLSQNLGARSL
jgi:hypothetical protein